MMVSTWEHIRKTMRCVTILIVSMLALCVFVTDLYAQSTDEIDVRSSRQDGYSRLVFDWPDTTGYKTARDNNNQLRIVFDKKAGADLSKILENPPANILGIKNAADNNNLSVIVTVPPQSRIRDFSIGGRIIFDVYDPPGGPVNVAKSDVQTPQAKQSGSNQGEESRTKPPPKPSEKEPQDLRTAEKPQTRQNETYRADDAQALKPESVDVDVLKGNALRDQAMLQENLPTPPDSYSVEGNHAITLTSTRALYLSAFRRGNDLWIIHNQPDNSVPPKITGPEFDKFPDFEDEKIHPEVRAYRLKLPNNVRVYTEGGGLLWRINVVQTPPEIQPVLPQTQFTGGSKKEANLFWAMPSSHFTIDFIDPDIGDTLHVVGVGKASDFSGNERFYIDLETLPTAAGLVIRPKVDDLNIKLVNKGVLVTKDNGLAVSKSREIENVFAKREIIDQEETVDDKGKQRIRRIYDFNRWIMGGPLNIRESENILLGAINQNDKIGKTENLLSLAKLYIANNRGPEALGYLNYAVDITRELEESPEFLALRGAAEALTGQFEAAFEDYASAELDKYEEIDMWRAATLAGLGDWDQAGNVLPDDTTLINSYPEPLRSEIALILAEIALRDGRQDQADDLLAIAKAVSDQLDKFKLAALEYLSGEAHRQRGENERAIALWTPLANSLDDLHRVKAGLSLTRLLYDTDRITAEEAIDRLEQLRYGWRGDTLETRIYQALGRFYLENKNYLKGLAILRRGTELSTTPALSQAITTDMSNAFERLFLTDEINKLSPLEAVSVYEEFQELTPAGKKGDKVVQMLAERLVEVGLLGRAAELMEYLINTRLSGEDAAQMAVRLASVQLLDDQPDDALQSLQKAREFLVIALKEDPALERDITLLEARAHSDKGNARRAISLLSRIPDQDSAVLRLRADIAWQSGDWSEAARSLERLVARERLSIQQPLSERQASLILNWAVALNLAGDRRALTSLRNRFSNAMQQTTRARLFEVVTRPRQNVRLTDRETIRAIVSEVDLFRDFLSSYEENLSGGKEPSN